MMAKRKNKASNVVGIYGGPAITPTPHEYVITCLEEALEQARAGEVVGIALAKTHGDTSTTVIRAGFSSRSLLGAVAQMQFALAREQEDG